MHAGSRNNATCQVNTSTLHITLYKDFVLRTENGVQIELLKTCLP